MKPYRIFVVEDEGIVAMEMEERLLSMGYRPMGSVATGEKALALIAGERPDLVLMDIRLKGPMDGIATAQEIRRRFHIPVIFLTAYSEDTTLERAKLVEPHGYILKPFDDRELKFAIEIALHKHAAEQEIRRLNQLYDLLSQVNQAVVRIPNRPELLQTICRLVVERAGMDFAWIGWRDGTDTRIVPIAFFGKPEEVPIDADFWTDSRPVEGLCNPEKAMREDRPFVCNRCGEELCLYPASKKPVTFGFQSCGSFPLHVQGTVCGTLNLCVQSPDFFQKHEIALLQEVAMNVSFALDKIEADAQRQRIEMQLRQSEAKFRSYIEHAPIGIFVVDGSGRFLEVNPAVAGMLGYTDTDLLGMSISDILPKVSLAEGLHHFQTVVEKGAFNARFFLQRKDGSPIWTFVSAVRLEENRIVAFFQDFTIQKQAEETLRQRLELQDQFAKIATSVPGVVYSFRLRPDGSGCIPFATPDIENLFGVSRDLLGKDIFPFYDNLHPEDFAHLNRTIAESGRNQSAWHAQFRYMHPSRGVRWIEGWSMPQMEPNGDIVWHGFLTDITQGKQLEAERIRVDAQFRQAQKMEAIGLLAGGIAHDFNNILSAIIGYSELAIEEVPRPSDLYEDLLQVRTAGLRARELVKQILTFSRQTEREPRPVEIGYIVKEAVKMLRATLPSTIVISQKAAVSPRTRIQADPTEIHQVVMNLCTNAAHAMRPHGGQLDITLDEVSLTPDEPLPHMDLPYGEYLCLRVRDTGPGIDQEILPKIFDPFFTTKPKEEGTGMGLSVVHGIVKSCGGAVTVESQPGNGAQFSVYLPKVTVEGLVHMADEKDMPKGKGRILFVDDEEQLSQMGKRVLERLGYTVTTKTSSQEALETVQSMPDGFDLVITDYTMPHMTGLDLAKAVKRARPGMPVIVCSGYNEVLNEKTASLHGIEGFFQKPYDTPAMLKAITGILGEKSL